MGVKVNELGRMLGDVMVCGAQIRALRITPDFLWKERDD